MAAQETKYVLTVNEDGEVTRLQRIGDEGELIDVTEDDLPEAIEMDNPGPDDEDDEDD